MVSVSSLGQTLMNDDEHKDFELIVYDGKLRVSVALHRLVLKTCSPFFDRLLGGPYQFFYIWNVPENAIASALRLVKFFYTRDLRDLGDLAQTLHLCTVLECADVYNLVNQVHAVKKRPRVVVKDSPKRRFTRSSDAPLSKRTRSNTLNRKKRRT